MKVRNVTKPMGALLLIGSFTGCIIFRYGLDNTLRMDPHVYALEGINTPYDDFNATAPPPPLFMDALLVFASNAESEGARFQIDAGRLGIIQEPFHHYRDKRPGPPYIHAERMGRFPVIPDLPHNIRGPTALFDLRTVRRADDAQVSVRRGEEAEIRPFPPAPGTAVYLPPDELTHEWALPLDVAREPLAWDDDERMPDVTWMFDSDQDGQRNLYFLDAAGAVQPFFGNHPDAADAYATYDFKRHVLYFCSNRSGRFEIYRYRNTSGNTDFASWLGDPGPAAKIERVEAFSAEGDAMAPFVEGDTLVFASDRPGGQGGFDLYISVFGEDDWDPPVNLQRLMPRGVRVNTAANEFRPAVLNLTLMEPIHPRLYYDWRVLVFSSDRSGGKGGYDLYLTALPGTVGR